jgi:hypothetical protein
MENVSLDSFYVLNNIKHITEINKMYQYEMMKPHNQKNYLILKTKIIVQHQMIVQ